MEKIDLTKYNSVQKKGLTYADVSYTKGYCEGYMDYKAKMVVTIKLIAVGLAVAVGLATLLTLTFIF